MKFPTLHTPTLDTFSVAGSAALRAFGSITCLRQPPPHLVPLPDVQPAVRLGKVWLPVADGLGQRACVR